MWIYYLRLAARSLKRNPALTSLMVLAIGMGIGASMTMITVLHVMSGDPLPARSAHLFYPHLDPLPLKWYQGTMAPDASADFTWVDAMALLHAHRARHQAVMSGASLLVRPPQAGRHPYYASGRYTTSGFFGTFGVKFVAGGGWSQKDDDSHARVVVLGRKLARELCSDTNCVGQSVHLSGYDFRVIGVTGYWNPQPKFYADVPGNPFGGPDQFFLPLSTAIELNLPVNGNQHGWCDSTTGNRKTSGCMTWLQVWVELDSPAQVAAYHQFLINYSAQQVALNRFQHPATDARLYGLMDWLAHENLVPNDLKLQLWLAVGFLFVCMVNIVALLLAKFLRRSNEISVRRALGARRRDIFVQFSIESLLIGLAGGVLGLGLAQLGLWSIRQRPENYAHLAQMDTPTLLGTLLLAIVTSLLAGILPSWRACRIPPALLLKTQ